MTRRKDPSRAVALLPVILAFTGCAGDVTSGEAPSDIEVGSVTGALGSATADYGCDVAASAGKGWVNTFMPQSTQSFDVLFRAHPSGADGQGNPLIDGVVGLSNGPATSFSSLGPIVRFNPWGYIDARNGDVYGGSFPYKTHEPYEFQVSVDIPSHRYTVWVRHLDAIAKPFELLAAGFAFRTQQNAVTRLDNVARFVDSAQGALQTCAFRQTGPYSCVVSRAGTWSSQAFPAKNRRFQVQLDALPAAHPESTVDAVIGVASGAPQRFSSLAAIVRFRPDGTMDARNGSSYAADVTFRYANTTTYRVTLDVDPVRHRYSVFVKDPMVAPEAPPTELAHDYAFRTEQATLSSFDHVGQFVDGTAGTLYGCQLTLLY